MGKKDEGILSKLIDGIFDLIYSKDRKYERILVILLLAGFFLRLIGALNMSVFADDMLYSSQSAGIIKSGILSTHSNPPLFFYLTDLAYSILGYTTLASRIWPLIFGTLTILLVFLLTEKLFKDKKIAMYAAFFATLSSFLIRMTFTEHSLVVFFFSFFAVYLGINYLESKNQRFLILSAIIFGLALLTKYNAPFFIISFGLFSIYFMRNKKEKILTEKNIKLLAVFSAIIILFALPFLAFNYFLYSEKGIVDVYFSRIIKLDSTQELYSGLAGQGDSFFDRLTKLDTYNQYKLPFKTDLLLTLFALGGILLLAKNKKHNILVFLGLFLIIPFILQSGGSALAKHFAFLPLVLSIPAGYMLHVSFKKVKVKTLKYVLLGILTILLVFNLGNTYNTPPNYLSSSEVSQAKSFVSNEVTDKDLIILDPRIYTAQAFWIATPNNLILLSQFSTIIEANQQAPPDSLVPVKAYLIECVIDDCGWGWIRDNQEFNQSIEQGIEALSSNANVVKRIYQQKSEGNEFVGEKEKIETFKIHSLTLNLHPSILEQTKLIQSFYFTPYMYENMNSYVFSYSVSGINTLIEKLALFIIYLAMVLSVLSIFYIFRFLAKDDNLKIL